MPSIYELGLLIKDIDNFDLSNFDGRLRFQKTIQILQSFGIDLGYRFSWYLRGPYSPTLTKDGFDLQDVIYRIPKLKMDFRRKEDDSRYSDFKELIQDKKDDPDQLEIVSSICFLYKEKQKARDEVLDLTAGKRKHFTMEQCRQIWDELARYGVVES